MTQKINPDRYICVKNEQDYKSRPLSDRILNEIRSIFNNIAYFTSLAPHFLSYTFRRDPSYCIPSGEDNAWRPKSDGLFILATGLNGHPAWAGPYLSRIQRERPNIEVRIPQVPHEGDTTLQEAADPIVAMARDYIRKNPGKPISIIGTSNGGRIAAYVETRLRNEPVSIRVTGIAGVYFGSERMSEGISHKIASFRYCPEIVTDLSMGSPAARTLIEEMRAPLCQGERSYEFYAATNDSFVPNFSSCHPLLGKGEELHLVEGHGHLSILGAVCERELDRALAWMDARSSE